MFIYSETKDKLSLKWIGPVRKIKKKQPSCLEEYQKQG